MHHIVEKIANNVKINIDKVNSVLNLSSEGSTVAFIARYRKENTGNLDEVNIRAILDERDKILKILDRQETIIKSIDEQKKLSKELKDKILTCFNKLELEDIYAPYKQKRKTKADLAKELGLEPFSDTIYRQRIEEGDYLKIARNYLDPLKKLTEVDKVVEHATNIIVEKIAHDVELKKLLRNLTFKSGFLSSKKAPKFKDENSKFDNFFDYKEKILNLKQAKNTHRVLAVLRGFSEKVLSINIEVSFNDCIDLIKSRIITNEKSIFLPIIKNAINLAYKNYMAPSIENDIFNELKEYADKEAVNVFAKNAKSLLLKAPLGEKPVIGIDPGFKSGAKVAVIDSNGMFVYNTTIYPVEPYNKIEEATIILKELCDKYNIFAIAVGNGTASRETLSFIDNFIKEYNLNTISVSVNEAGASIYSASDIAREEFPNLDLTVRGAISIARRLQDPLAELVKIDSKSIGVGQYQHDVDQNLLKESLDAVVEDCVNFVGVDLNTASKELLSYVSGISLGLAGNIVEYRNTNGKIKSRQDLINISRFSSKVFEQAAGFLRIRDGINPLDNTAVHPERYEFLLNLFKNFSIDIKEIIGNEKKINELFSDKALKESLGEYTYKDIIEELKKPGRDPRESFKKISFNPNVSTIQDLKPNMILNGVVNNITNFGVFVDIGVHVDGLVHVSELTNKTFVKDPRDIVNLDAEVQVRVLEIDIDKKQLALSFILDIPNKIEKTYNPDFKNTNIKDKPYDNFKNKDFKPTTNKDNLNKNSKFNNTSNYNKQNNTYNKPKERPIRVNPNSPFASLLSIRDKVKK